MLKFATHALIVELELKWGFQSQLCCEGSDPQSGSMEVKYLMEAMSKTRDKGARENGGKAVPLSELVS